MDQAKRRSLLEKQRIQNKINDLMENRDFYIQTIKQQIQELDEPKPFEEINLLEEQERKTLEGRDFTVCVRARPLLPHELEKQYFPVITTNNPNIILHNAKINVKQHPVVEKQKFNVDYAFGPQDNNESVYNLTGKPLVKLGLSGGIGAMFAYGQTGSGKTFTIQAICQRMGYDIFKYNQQRHKIFIGFFELLGNKSMDLLDQDRKVEIMEDKFGKVQAKGLLELEVQDGEQFQQLVSEAQNNRRTQATFKNDVSSRTHSICQIRIKNENVPEAEDGYIYIIDLVGSENASDSQFHDQSLFKETKDINKSLMALKECIRNRALASLNNKYTHVPYRQSKLTLLLKDNFDMDSFREYLTMVCNKYYNKMSVNMDDFVPFETGKQALMLEESEFIFRLKKIGYPDKQAKQVHDQFYKKFIDNRFADRKKIQSKAGKLVQPQMQFDDKFDARLAKQKDDKLLKKDKNKNKNQSFKQLPKQQNQNNQNNINYQNNQNNQKQNKNQNQLQTYNKQIKFNQQYLSHNDYLNQNKENSQYSKLQEDYYSNVQLKDQNPQFQKKNSFIQQGENIVNQNKNQFNFQDQQAQNQQQHQNGQQFIQLQQQQKKHSLNQQQNVQQFQKFKTMEEEVEEYKRKLQEEKNNNSNNNKILQQNQFMQNQQQNIDKIPKMQGFSQETLEEEQQRYEQFIQQKQKIQKIQDQNSQQYQKYQEQQQLQKQQEIQNKMEKVKHNAEKLRIERQSYEDEYFKQYPEKMAQIKPKQQDQIQNKRVSDISDKMNGFNDEALDLQEQKYQQYKKKKEILDQLQQKQQDNYYDFQEKMQIEKEIEFQNKLKQKYQQKQQFENEIQFYQNSAGKEHQPKKGQKKHFQQQDYQKQYKNWNFDPNSPQIYSDSNFNTPQPKLGKYKYPQELNQNFQENQIQHKKLQLQQEHLNSQKWQKSEQQLNPKFFKINQSEDFKIEPPSQKIFQKFKKQHYDYDQENKDRDEIQVGKFNALSEFSGKFQTKSSNPIYQSMNYQNLQAYEKNKNQKIPNQQKYSQNDKIDYFSNQQQSYNSQQIQKAQCQNQNQNYNNSVFNQQDKKTLHKQPDNESLSIRSQILNFNKAQIDFSQKNMSDKKNYNTENDSYSSQQANQNKDHNNVYNNQFKDYQLIKQMQNNGQIYASLQQQKQQQQFTPQYRYNIY
ncbi:P-loop containing nucleoside triphosphate hydrolase [Pseudocohnilembus persalinus]|uniref:p-loop containing nucleoside triphosphate hydrolase n=1 Tax=Pseudocohnilembus persalinus TaxID=266149 RepID=A0A0V0Q7A4_PSEPJ|nr:P-loop containing nucleoside triphosphate hydrolase [Pseudocohnilembus persalinus]|eukprot:KRW98086.1 P-loop containing nucleoside triphosphate hydrolase [Pseudocohnilembus persalinus]